MRLVGVDPGRQGYAVALDTVTSQGWALRLPYDAHGSIAMGFARWLMKICQGHEACVFLEKLNATGGDVMSKNTLFKMGFAYGQLDAIIRATLIPSRLVTPQQWQKVVTEGIDQKLSAKDKTMLTYQRMFPDDPIPRRPRQKKIDDNAVDAFFIAQYGALKFGGGQMVKPGDFVHCERP